MRVWKLKTMLPMKIYENLCAFDVNARGCVDRKRKAFERGTEKKLM